MFFLVPTVVPLECEQVAEERVGVSGWVERSCCSG